MYMQMMKSDKWIMNGITAYIVILFETSSSLDQDFYGIISERKTIDAAL